MSLTGDVDLPGVGKVDKKIVIPIAVAAAAFIGWRFWVARSAPADDGTVTDGEFGAVDSSIPGVIGAVSPDNSYGSGDPVPQGTDSYGFSGTTNAQWTQYVTAQLQQASDSWSYGDIVTALGNFLDNRPLSDQQQAIARAAVAVGGYPPSGSHTIVPGGNTAITVAPTGLKVASTTATTATLSFGAVAGATGYRAYRGTGSNVGSSNTSTLTVSGLKPNTSYTFTVKAVSASGATGPDSGPATGKTKGVTLKTPAKPKVSAIAKTSAHVSTGASPDADGYNWYVNGVAHGHSDHPSYTLSGLKSKTTYRVSVAADTSTGGPSKASALTSFKTK